MAVFRGTDRIRKMTQAIRQRFRRVRSTDLKGMTVVDTQREPSKFSREIRYYRAPILVTAAAAVALAGVATGARAYVDAHSESYYRVIVDGQPIGEISDQRLIGELIESKERELEQAATAVRYILEEPSVAFKAERAYKKTPDDEATLQRLSGMLETHAVGVELKVNGQVVGIVRDEQTAKSLLQRVKNKYVPEQVVKDKVDVRTLSATPTSDQQAAAGKPQRTVESVVFLESVSTDEREIEPDQLSDPEELYRKLVTGDPATRTYTVKEGDCIGCIAASQNVSRELIYKNNPWIVDDIIHVGDVLDLTEEQPLLNVQSVEQVTELESIEPKVEYVKNDDMKVGQTKTVSKGKPGKQLVTYRLVKRNGSLIEEERISAQLLEPAQPTVIMKGTKVVKGEGTGKFAYPVSGAKITSYFGKRWGRLHEGLDMVGNKNIMAADHGVIEFAGRKNGLGNAIIINHNNGFKTTYGHLSKINVKKGQKVEKGDVIGIMGNTGNSTGTHLHFEIELNGKVKNPLSYL